MTEIPIILDYIWKCFENRRFFSIAGTTTFTDVNFQSDIQVEKFNHLDMNLLIPLHTEQSIEFLKCDNVTVDKMQILGRINDVNLQEIQYNTFMVCVFQINQLLTYWMFFENPVFLFKRDMTL